MRMLLDTFAQTLRTLWAHKLRSFLTMFGIAWGVGSLLLLVGVGEGFRNGNRKQLETFGFGLVSAPHRRERFKVVDDVLAAHATGSECERGLA